MTATDHPDIIDALAGLSPGSAVEALRSARPEARHNAQASYLALFAPAEAGSFTLRERFAVAAFVTRLHGDGPDADHYERALLAQPASVPLAAVVRREAEGARTTGPYGAYPAGPLSAEDVPGPAYRVSDLERVTLGERLTAALEHAHLLVFRPRESSAEALQELVKAGWSTPEIVTLSQIVAFLAFQIRVAAGLRVLAA